ncbi:uracil-DNA glycosylase family protein [Enterococcus sp. AZ007]
METTIPLFQKAGIEVTTIQDILSKGIYLTNAIKTPKTETTVANASIDRSLPYLEKELSLFPNVQVIMLMGDVAKKCFNKITKKATKKNAVPAISTYKLRNTAIYYQDIRIMPSYIMTGKNILIEKSKVQMACEDLAVMFEIIS